MENTDSILNVAAAADMLGVCRQRVLQFIAEGRLPANRLGRRSFMIRRGDLRRLRRRPTGRPLKPPKIH